MKFFLKINSLILLALIGFFNAQAQFGILDSSFATNGTFQTTGSVSDISHTVMAELSDGKLLTTSYYRNNNTSPYFSRVLKLNANGSTDNSFGVLGYFPIPSASLFNIRIRAMKVQLDGKIVVAGTNTATASLSSTQNYFVARIKADGSSLDNLFNSGQGFKSSSFLSATSDSYVSEVLITSSGKIVIVGHTFNSTTGARSITMERLNSDGSVDNSFGTLGTYAFSQLNKFNQPICATQLPNDNILVGGCYAQSPGLFFGIMVKVLADGSGEDNTWDTNGYSYPAMSGYINGLNLLPSGEVICTNSNKMKVCKLSATGVLDTNFATSGIYTLNGGISYAYDVDVQDDGKIVLGGKIETTTGKENICLLRLNSKGPLDNTFGQSGIVDLAISAAGDDYVRDITINSSGSIYAYGSTDGEMLLSKFKGSWPTATNDTYKNIDLAVYPNPSSQNINIKLNGIKVNEATAIVYSLLGEKVMTQKINTTQTAKVEVSQLTSGQYIIQLKDNNQQTIAVQKFSVL